MKKSSLIFILFVLQASFCISQYQILRWFNGKEAAVTLTFDGNTKGQLQYALPLLNKRHVSTTFFINSETADWKKLIDANKHHHEIGSHTLDSIDSSHLNWKELNENIKHNYDAIRTHIPEEHCNSFSYPYGTGTGDTEMDDSIRHIVAQYHFAARGTGRAGKFLGHENFDDYYEYQNELFENYYLQTGSFLMHNNTSSAQLGAVIRKTITSHGWFIPAYIDITKKLGSNYNAVCIDSFSVQLDTLLHYAEDLWIAPFCEVVQYHKERESATLKILSKEEHKWTLQLVNDLKDNEDFRFPLTVQLVIPQNKKISSISQKNEKMTYLEALNIIQFNAIPNNDKIILTFE